MSTPTLSGNLFDKDKRATWTTRLSIASNPITTSIQHRAQQHTPPIFHLNKLTHLPSPTAANNRFQAERNH